MESSSRLVYNNAGLTAVFFELLQSGVLSRPPMINSDENIDWDYIMELSSKQGVLAWVWEGICKLPKEQQPSRRQRINWALSVSASEDRYEKQRAVLKEIVDICAQNSMRVLVLKGISLAELYPKPCCRPSGDLDLFFFHEYEKGNLLFGNSDMRVSPKHAEFVFHNVKVENHSTFLDLNWETREMVEKYLENRLDESVLTKDGYYIFTPQCQFLFVFFHLMRHLESFIPSLSIRSIVDLPVLLNSYPKELSPECCFDLVDRFNMSYCFELFIYFSEWSLCIDLVHYKRGIIPTKDVSVARKMFYHFQFSNYLLYDSSFVMFYKNIKQYIVVYRWKSKFLHVVQGEFFGSLRLIFHVRIKQLFGMPIDEPFWKSLKTKFCNSLWPGFSQGDSMMRG